LGTVSELKATTGPVAAVLLVLASAGLGRAADWPQYRGPGRDGVAPEVRLPDAWPKKLQERWRIRLGEGFSSPAVAGGRAFVISQEGRDEVVRCLDAGTGREIWRHAYRAEFRSSWGDGPRATPTVAGDRVYTVGGTGEMYCLAAADGRVAWSKSFRRAFRFRVPTYGYSPSPLVDGERLLVHVGGRRRDSVVAMDKRTGKVIWKALSDPPGYASPMIVPASPSRGGRQLIVFTEHALVSLDPKGGELYWRYPWRTTYEQNIAQPVLHGDLLVITSLTGTAALRLAVKNGKPSFRQAWRKGRMTTHFSCPVGYKGCLYAAWGRSPVLRCVEIATGAVRWSRRGLASQRAGIVVADGKLLIYTDAGRLIVADASPHQYREYADIRVAGHNWIPPVLADGRLFLRDSRSLRCIDLPGG